MAHGKGRIRRLHGRELPNGSLPLIRAVVHGGVGRSLCEHGQRLLLAPRRRHRAAQRGQLVGDARATCSDGPATLRSPPRLSTDNLSRPRPCRVRPEALLLEGAYVRRAGAHLRGHPLLRRHPVIDARGGAPGGHSAAPKPRRGGRAGAGRVRFGGRNHRPPRRRGRAAAGRPDNRAARLYARLLGPERRG